MNSVCLSNWLKTQRNALPQKDDKLSRAVRWHFRNLNWLLKDDQFITVTRVCVSGPAKSPRFKNHNYQCLQMWHCAIIDIILSSHISRHLCLSAAAAVILMFCSQMEWLILPCTYQRNVVSHAVATSFSSSFRLGSIHHMRFWRPRTRELHCCSTHRCPMLLFVDFDFLPIKSIFLCIVLQRTNIK